SAGTTSPSNPPRSTGPCTSTSACAAAPAGSGAPLSKDTEPGGRAGGGHRTEQLQNPSARIADDVQLAVGVDAERADVAERPARPHLRRVLDDVRRGRLARDRIDDERQRPDAALDEIGEEIPAGEGRAEARAAINVATGHRLADAMTVFVDRLDERRE